MPKGNTAKLQTLTDNLKFVTTINPPDVNGLTYLALYTTNPDNNDSGVEASYSGYARQAISFGNAILNQNVAEISNINTITFGVVPVSAGSISYGAIRTALTGGILLYFGSLGATYYLLQGVEPAVPIGNLTIYEN